jgi:hypothetical protein
MKDLEFIYRQLKSQAKPGNLVNILVSCVTAYMIHRIIYIFSLHSQ